MNERTSFGAVLRRYRLAAGLSQEALAASALLSARTISDLERGIHRAPRANTIDLLASALGLTPEQRAVLLAAAHPDLEAPLITQTPPLQRRYLPMAPTQLIGREPERSQARAALLEDRSRLLTVTGPSGVGKTRLALEVATDLMIDFTDGVVFVDLAPMREATLLYERILEALGLREQPQASAADLLQVYLRDKRLLLVLDNFEHVREAAPLVAQLLAHCPQVAVIVTSRISLRLRGEQLLPLAPLPLDAAVTLFRERALAVRPDQHLVEADIEAICERVDRLPLAIELAAAESRIFPLGSLLEQLTHRLSFLRSGATDAPTRQQTMEAAIAWSYDLLDETQRRCFRALGVFTGGWTLEAAQAVCWPEGDPAKHETLLILAALVDASMARAEESPSRTVRFYLLELLREYALARLIEAGEEQERRRSHANYFATLADTIAHFGPGMRAHGAVPTPELANARAALEWALSAEEVALGLRLAGFGRIWHILGQKREAITCQERVLALDQRIREIDAKRAAPLELRVERLYGLARTLLGYGEYERAETCADEALRLAQFIDDEEVLSNIYATRGMVAQAHGQYDEAASAFTASYALTTPDDLSGLRYRVLALLAETEQQRGNEDIAMAHLEDAIAASIAFGNTWDTARLSAILGSLAQKRGDTIHATRAFREALTIFRRFGSPNFSAWCLEGYAAVLVEDALLAEATRLFAAAAAARTLAQSPAPPAEREKVEALLAMARARLDDAAYAEAWRAGAALSCDAAIAEALTLGARRLNASAPSDASTTLSDA